METEEDHSDMTQRLLDFAFELISMLTRQVFTSLRSGNMLTVMAPSHSFVIPERPDMRKLLEVTNKIIELLTGEVPIGCQDLMVSMEERQYLEGNKKLYKAAMMEDQTIDGSRKRNPPETSPHPNNCQDSAQEEPHPAENKGRKGCENDEVKHEVKEEETEIAVTVKKDDSPGESGTDRECNRTSPDGHHILSSDCKTEYGNIEEDSKEKTPITQKTFPAVPPSSDSSAPAEGVSYKTIPVTEHSRCKIDKWFPCSVCGLCFNQKEALAVHERVHMYRRICPYPEDNKSSEHSSVPKGQQRPQTVKRPFSCPECGQNFTQKDSLTRHKLLHTGEKRYKCSKCDKSYAAKWNLICHERTHTGEKPFPCRECGKRFTRNTHLREHQRIHTGERPYCCDQCGKYFIQKSGFTKHQELYCGHKYPVQCLDCGRCFKQNSYLLLHQRTHTSRTTQGTSPDS